MSVAAVTVAAAAGCAGAGGEATPMGPSLAPQLGRIDAVAGAPIAAPVARRDLAPLTAADRVEVGVEGAAVAATVVRASVEAGAERGLWLPPSGRWVSRPLAAAGDRGVLGFAMLVVPTPPSGQPPDGLVVNGERWPVRTLPAPAADPPWLTPVPVAPTNPDSLARLLAPAVRHPLRRWRVGLLADRFDAAGSSELAASLRGRRFDDPSLEALAAHTEALWRAGLDLLAAEAPLLAAQVAARLTMVVDFGDGWSAPAWPVDQESLQRLREDLLDPTLTGSQRLARARAWLDAEPAGVAWVEDDAGAADVEAGVAVPVIGFAPFSRGGASARLVRGDGRLGPVRRPGPAQAVRLVMAAPLEADQQEFTVVAGEERYALAPLSGALPAQPPGAPLGPGVADWDLRSFLRGRAELVDAPHAVGALLQRGADAGAGEGGWEIYIECRTPEQDPESDAARRRQARDEVRLWFGPTERPLAALRIDGAGRIEDLLSPDEPARLAPLSRSADRWSVHVPVPTEAIEAGRYLRVALMRVDPDGVQATWPRPMAPWKEAPGRALFDLRAWEGGVARR